MRRGAACLFVLGASLGTALADEGQEPGLLRDPAPAYRFLAARHDGDAAAADAVLADPRLDPVEVGADLLRRLADLRDRADGRGEVESALRELGRRADALPAGRGLAARVSRWLAWEPALLAREGRLRDLLGQLRTPTARDAATFAALRSQARADLAAKEGSPAAVAFLDEAAELLETSGDRPAALEALLEATRRADALPWPRASLRLRERLGHRLQAVGRRDAALVVVTRYGELAVALGRERASVTARRWRAESLLAFGRFDDARADAEAAIAAAARTGLRDEEALARLVVGTIELRTDHPGRAAAIAQEARATLVAAGHRTGAALALALMGRAAQAEGRLGDAVTILERAAAEARGSPVDEARVLSNLADVEYRLGRDARAVELRRRALGMLRGAGHVAEADVLEANLALALAREDRHEEAIAIFRSALDGARRRRDPEAVAGLLLNVGLSLSALGRLEEAEAAYRESREGFAAVGRPADEAWAVSGIGLVLSLERRWPEAAALARESVARFDALGLRDVYSATARIRLARTLGDTGHLAEALAYAEEAVRMRRFLAADLSTVEAERIRRQTREAADDGVFFAYRLHGAARGPDAAADVLARAFALVEGSRAAALAAALAERGGAAPPPADVVAEDRATRERVEAAQDAVLAAAHEAPADLERAAGVRAALDRAYADRESAVARAARLARQGSDLGETEPLSLADARTALGERRALVAYHRTAHGLFVLVATRTGATFQRVAAPDDLDDLCRTWIDLASSAGGPEADLAARLYDLLVRPIEGSLAEADAVTIVPDGALAQLPFAALLRRDAGGDRRFVERWAVAFAPSASAAAALRRRGAARGRGVAAFADPDPAAGAAGPEAARLPESAAEARDVADLYPERRLVRVGAQATRAALAEALAAPDRWAAVHLACHAYADAERPGLSALVMAGGERLDVDGVAATRVDADLVVLSACETAKGRFTYAEGVLGFARAFFLAGAPRVVASGWRVSDASTRPLMRRFHRALRVEGLPATLALREAQLEALHGGGPRAHPSQWAAFVLWGTDD